MRSYIRAMLLPTLCVFMIICSGFVCSAESVNRYEYIEIQPTLKAESIEPIVIISEQPLEETVSAVEIEEYVEDTLLPREDIELIALVTMAEAEGECEEGKRLVIDTILNRVDSVYFPDNVHDVVYQKHQFSSMWNGRKLINALWMRIFVSWLKKNANQEQILIRYFSQLVDTGNMEPRCFG